MSPSSDGSETELRYYVYGYDFVGGRVDVAKTEPNYTSYGVLYNWVAAKAACPSGWHLPTDAEWKILETSLGMSQSDADGFGLRDSGSIGKALEFTSGWAESGNGDNRSGFAALPGGCRNYTGGGFYLGSTAFFWSSSEYSESYALIRSLTCDLIGVYRLSYYRHYGFSVRCLQNN